MLYKLIGSLTTKEKNAFRRHTKLNANGKESQYLRLFEIIDKQKKVKEEITNLAVIKNQLYNLILDFLRIYHSKEKEQSGKIRFYQLAIDIHILLKKGLPEQALKRIDKAKKIALTYDLQASFLPLTVIERRLLRSIAKKKATKTKLLVLQKEYNGYLTNIKNEFQLLDLYEKDLLTPPSQTPEETETYLLSKLEMLKQQFSPDQFLFNGQIYYHGLKAAYYKKLGQYAAQKESIKALIELFEKRPHLLKNEYDYQVRYLGFLQNYFNTCFYSLEEIEELPSIIEKIRNVTAKNIKLETEVFYVSNYISIVYFITRRQFIDVINLTATIQLGLEKYHTNFSKDKIDAFDYNLGLAHFGNGDLEDALKYTNKIIYSNRNTIRPDILLKARFLELLIRIEQKEFTLAEYRIAAFKQFIRQYENSSKLIKYKILSKLEKIIKQQKVIITDELQHLCKVKNEEELSIWLEIHRAKLEVS